MAYALIPAKAGIQKKNWIPGQARNDKLWRTYVVVYINEIIHEILLFFGVNDDI